MIEVFHKHLCFKQRNYNKREKERERETYREIERERETCEWRACI